MRVPDVELIDIPCPDCGEVTAESIERVARNDVIPCSLCSGLIDLGAESCAAAVAKARARMAALKS